MERTIKFIWDYYGDPAERTAAHHGVHLAEFAEERKLSIQKTGYEKMGEKHFSAYILLKEKEAIECRELLRPEQAFVISEED